MSDSDYDAQQRGAQMAVERAFSEIIQNAQARGIPDGVIEGAVVNILCFMMCHHYSTDRKGIAEVNRVLPMAMANQRHLYDAIERRKKGH